MYVKDPYTNEQRYFNLYLPEVAMTPSRHAVLISLHGYSVDAESMQKTDKLNERLNKRNVYVAYGQAVKHTSVFGGMGGTE